MAFLWHFSEGVLFSSKCPGVNGVSVGPRREDEMEEAQTNRSQGKRGGGAQRRRSRLKSSGELVGATFGARARALPATQAPPLSFA